MKKTILASICCAAMLLASCAESKKASDATPEDQALGDSIATALGTAAGTQENQKYQQYLNQMSETEKANFKKEEFIRGLELVLKTDTANIAYLNGIFTGLNLFNPVAGMSRDGIPVDPDILIKAFRTAYMADSVGDVQAAMTEYRRLYMQVQARVTEKQEQAKAESPEAKQNVADGEKLIKDKLAEGYQKTESGLVYKIDNPGEGDKVTRDDKIKIAYVGKHVNGEVFDQSEGYSAQASGFIPGFTEGLTLLGKGGSATLVIPADLAYGVNGAGQSIGPNETLIFEISILDIEK